MPPTVGAGPPTIGAPVEGVTLGVCDGVTAGVWDGVTYGVWEGATFGVVCPGCAVWASEALAKARSVAAPRIFNMAISLG